MRNEQPINFDPNEAKVYPSIAEVECLLGGVGRRSFADGTQQFADKNPDIVYSPRLDPEALADFCSQNIYHYRAHYERYEAEIDAGDTPEIMPFWELE
jgi:hypothetical protein